MSVGSFDSQARRYPVIQSESVSSMGQLYARKSAQATGPRARLGAEVKGARVSSRGRFIVVEGCDGSGKSAIVNRAVDVLLSRGTDAVVCNRLAPSDQGHQGEIILGVGRLFAAAERMRVPQEELATAAATQYAALYWSDVAPRVEAGQVVFADSWWGKTWARLCVEAACLGYVPAAFDDLVAWMPGLLRLPPTVTMLLDTPQSDRVAWYLGQDAGSRDIVYDDEGQPSTDPAVFGEFTRRIQSLLTTQNSRHGWPIVANGSDRSVEEAAGDLLLAAGLAKEPQA
jgi:thymidylate kinase